MKTIRPTSISAAMSAIALSFVTVPFVSAQSYNKDKDAAQTNDQNRTTANRTTETAHAKDYRLEQRSAAIIGRDVYSAEHTEIGEVSDLVVDAHTGRIVFAIVESGGILGIGEHERAVPFSALNRTLKDDDKVFAIDLTEAKWKAAPEIRRDELASLDNTRRDSLFAYFGASSDYLRVGPVTPNRQPVANGRQTGSMSDNATNPIDAVPSPLLRLSELTGKDLRSGNSEVGEIEDVLVNLDRRQASLLLDPEDDFAGIDDKLVIAFSRVSLTPSDRGIDHIDTDLKPQDLKDARHRETSASSSWLSNENGMPYVWTDGTMGTVPYMAFSPERDSTMSAHDKQVSADTVRDALEKDPAIGDAMDTVQVERSGDSLVLTGRVSTEEMKTRINRTAQAHAGKWPVQNRIVVKRAD